MNTDKISITNQSNVQFLLVTANTGTVFEKPELLTAWVNEFAILLRRHPADFVALHCQEVGGKDYERFMHILDPFIKNLLEIPEIATNFTHYRLYFDSDYTSQDTFTALGSLYFIRNNLQIQQWNFITSSFESVTDRRIFTGNLSNTPTLRKEKFPSNFYPATKWFRKGFTQTRWLIDNFLFDMVNVHLFHDASNLVAAEQSPSVYSQYRQNALEYTLQSLPLNESDAPVPYAIFGDFNFRLDCHRLLRHIAEKRNCSINQIKQTDDGEISKIVMKNSQNKTKLVIEKKEFDFYDDHNTFFTNDTGQFHAFDVEFSPFTDELFEYQKDFPPSYPYSEEHDEAHSFLRARCPAWCDRVLVSHLFNKHTNTKTTSTAYNILGEDICMGDHKPVFLAITIDTAQDRAATTNLDSYAKSVISSDNIAISNCSRSLATAMRPNTHNKTADLILNDVVLLSSESKQFNVHDYAIFVQPGVLPHWWITEIRQRSTKSISNTNSSSALWAKVRAVAYMTTLAHRTGSWYSEDQTGKSINDNDDMSSTDENDEKVLVSNVELNDCNVFQETDLPLSLRRSFSSIDCTKHDEHYASKTVRSSSTTQMGSADISFNPSPIIILPPTSPPVSLPSSQSSSSSRVYRFLHCIIL